MKMAITETTATAAMPMVVVCEPDISALLMVAAAEPSACDSSSPSSKVCSLREANSKSDGLLEALAMSTASSRLSSLRASDRIGQEIVISTLNGIVIVSLMGSLHSVLSHKEYA